MQRDNSFRKILSLFLAVTLVVSLNVPMFAFAEENGSGATDLGSAESGTVELNTELNAENTSIEENQSANSSPSSQSSSAKAARTAEGIQQQSSTSIAKVIIGSTETEVSSITELINLVGNETEFTIVLLADVEIPGFITIASTQTVNLDLNGFTLSTTLKTGDNSRHYYAIDNYGVFTLSDSSSSQTGAIKARGIENLGSGKMTIKSGTIYSIDANGGACVWNEAELYVEGGTFKTEHAGSAGDTSGPGCLNNSGTATITAGTFTSVNKRVYAIISTGKMTITPSSENSVTVFGAHGGLASDGGSLEVNGGDYSSTEYYGLYVSNDDSTATVIVNGGTFTGKNSSAWIGSDVTNQVDSCIKITGGYFNNPIVAQINTIGNPYVITGGTFTTNGYDAFDVSAYYDTSKYCQNSKGTVVPCVKTENGLTIALPEESSVEVEVGAAEQEILDNAFDAKIDEIKNAVGDLPFAENVLRSVLNFEMDKEIIKREIEIIAKELEINDVPSGDVSSINNELEKNEVVAAYFDLSVNMLVEVKVGGEEAFQIVAPSAIEIDSLPGPITFKLKVDPALIAGKDVRIAHVHNGNTEFIEPESVDFENGIITFKTQTFSTYAVLTSDKSNSDGEEIPGDTEEPANPNQPGSSDNSGTSTDNKTSNKSGKNLTETGDATGNMVMGMSVLAFISAAACVTMVVRRRVRQK